MPNYPRELHLGRDIEERLKAYLDEILLAHDSERQGFLNDVMGWQRDYWAKPESTPNNYPFQGACNLIIPINAINVEAIFARVMTTHDALPELVAAKIKNPNLTSAERPLEQFIDADLKQRVRYRERIKSPILEIIKLGTGVGYSHYEKITRQAVREIGGVEEKFEVTVKEGAVINGLPLTRFLFPFNATSLETAPWLGEEHTATPYEIRLMEDSGLFRPGTMERFEYWLSSFSTDEGANSGLQVERYQQDLENRRPVWPKELNWQEIWLAFDVDNDGHDEEIVVHYHKTSREFLSIRYNWNEDLRRKYRVGNYFPVEYRIAGIGVGKQVEQFMSEITTQHRQSIDAATIANAPMLKVSKMSGYGPGEAIYPGKMWFLDDMSHIEPMVLPDIYQSQFANEAQTMTLMQQRTGINDVTLGMPQAGTPGTATDTLARVKEGSNKFDFAYSNIKSFLDDLIMDYVCDTAQFGARFLDLYVNEDTEKIRSILSLSPTELRTGLTLELRTSGQKDSKLQDRQDWQTLSPQLQQYFASLIQLSQLMGRPDITQAIAIHGMNAATEAMKQILQTFDVRNLDRILFDATKLMGPNNGQNGIINPQLLAGGNGNGFAGNSQIAGLSGIASLLGGG